MLRCPRRGCGVCQDKEVGFGSASGGRLMSLGWDLRYTWDRNSSRESAQDQGGPGDQLHRVSASGMGWSSSGGCGHRRESGALVSSILLWLLTLSVWGLSRGSSGSELAQTAS